MELGFRQLKQFLICYCHSAILFYGEFYFFLSILLSSLQMQCSFSSFRESLNNYTGCSCKIAIIKIFHLSSTIQVLSFPTAFTIWLSTTLLNRSITVLNIILIIEFSVWQKHIGALSVCILLFIPLFVLFIFLISFPV